jgi:DNA primase
MDFVEQLKSSIDIVEVVRQYVRLKRIGSGQRYVGLCPFHAEKTPSFNVHGARQFYHCFGCGVSGDAIKFVMEIGQLSFYEALKLLSERYGIPMPKRAEYSDPETKFRSALYRMHEIAGQMFRAALDGPSGGEARGYLVKRRLTPALIDEFALGYSEKSGQALVRAFEKEGFPQEQMEASGLVLKRQDGSGFFDRFRGRLMFPIHSESGKVIAFAGRALSPEDEPKYMNSPETPIYKKSFVLYNLHRARAEIRKQDRSVLVEGYMDVIGVWSAGVRELVASCGTALTSQQVRILKRHSDKIVVNFDPDAAGVNAAERSIQMLLEEGLRVKVVQLEGGLDPDEYVKDRGADAYRQRLESAPGYFYWLADRARAHYDTRNADGRIASLQFLLPAIQRVSDKLERATIANDLATYLGIDPGLVLDHFRKAATERREIPLPAPRQPVTPLESMLLNALLSSQEARRQILPRLAYMPAVQEFATRRIFQALLAVAEAQPQFSFAELEARLEDNDKQLLAAAVFADESTEESQALEQALACLRELERAGRESQRSALRARVKEAERAGNLAEALKWTEELGRLDRD